ncbi:MED14-domain-containing protein [Microthyrium microscopicum]|uniref:Mediator of RNA polymerase II transcription subunit 14 n=1 Tax=Microthyrium microscopicum TaxID=703497 RepID=A0A6A6TUZ4_9PEZI|nr:MED14-domain-containing protein [Microthyrium microscopicum]
MPGRIFVTMSSSGANGADHGVHSKSNGNTGSLGAAGKSTQQQQNDREHQFAVHGGINGDHGPSLSSLQNGISKSAHVLSSPSQGLTNGNPGINPMDPNNSLFNLPAEVIESMELELTPFSVLVERASRHTFKTLNEKLSLMVLMSVNEPGINGSSHLPFNGASQSTTGNNNSKKRELLEWANTNREMFIKLMVLSGWSHANAEVIIPLLKLKWWSDAQHDHLNLVLRGIADAKNGFFRFKLKRPDIQTSLDVLATGTDSRMPDLGYIPKPKCTSKEALRTIQTLNTLLRIRLTVHEDLPLHLRNYTVVDGCATFSFPGEFEFSVTVGSDDPSEQMFFVNLKFLFEPSTNLGEGQAMEYLRNKVDETISLSGLPGCFDMLRNFVQTHQIRILREQTTTLSQEAWKSVLRLQNLHRWLVVHYWTNSSFPKSWLEIGISSEEGKERLLPGTIRMPQIRCKWRIFGKLVEDEELDLQLRDLSMGKILNRAIARQITEMFKTAQQALHEKAPASELLHTELNESNSSPHQCSLRVQLGVNSRQSSIHVEPFTGNICIRPVSDISPMAERDLNSMSDPMKELADKLEVFLCRNMIQQFNQQAPLSGWEISRLSFAPEYLEKKLSSKKFIRYGFYKPAWWKRRDFNWFIAVTVNLEGENWMAIRVSYEGSRAKIESVNDIRMLDAASNRQPIGFQLLRKIEMLAIRAITLRITADNLLSSGSNVSVQWLPQKPSLPVREQYGQRVEELLSIPSLNFSFTQVVPLVKKFPSIIFPDNLQLLYGRHDALHSKVSAIVKGFIPWIANLVPVLSSFDPAVTFGPRGVFTIRLEADFGESLDKLIKQRVTALVYATTILLNLDKAGIKPSQSSLSCITFTYSSDIKDSPSYSPTPLSMALNFLANPDSVDADDAITASIKFFPEPNNPHQRMHDNLEEIAAARPLHLLNTLEYTLPLIRAARSVELHGNVVRSWKVSQLRLVYPTMPTVFEVQYSGVQPGRKDNQPHWRVYESRPGGRTNANQPNQRSMYPPGYDDEMKAFFGRAQHSARGFSNMLICKTSELEQIILDLDVLMRRKLAERDAIVAANRNNAPVGAGRGAPPSVRQQGPPQQQPPQQVQNVSRPNPSMGRPLSGTMRGGAPMNMGRGGPMNLNMGGMGRGGPPQQQQYQQQQPGRPGQNQQQQNRGRGPGPGSNRDVITLD